MMRAQKSSLACHCAAPFHCHAVTSVLNDTAKFRRLHSTERATRAFFSCFHCTLTTSDQASFIDVQADIFVR